MEKKENLTRNNTESPEYFLESPADPCVLLTKTRQKVTMFAVGNTNKPIGDSP
jgi:hypothetical protein